MGSLSQGEEVVHLGCWNLLPCSSCNKYRFQVMMVLHQPWLPYVTLALNHHLPWSASTAWLSSTSISFQVAFVIASCLS